MPRSAVNQGSWEPWARKDRIEGVFFVCLFWAETYSRKAIFSSMGEKNYDLNNYNMEDI